ncbi:hypothetical protein IZY60_07465 [Lutibacter sp. B2]|nr:hypothetical protein [Lutibacter sp. B2]
MIKTYKHNKLSSVYQYLIVGILIVLIGDSIKDQQYLKVFIGVLLIYVSLYEKEVSIEDEGVLIQIKRIRRKKEKMIKFAQMKHISIQKRNDKALMFFAKEDMGQKAIVDAENVEKIVGLAKKRNKKIDIYYA